MDNTVLEVSESVANGNEQYGLRNVGATLRSAGNNRAINNGTADYVGDITGGGSY